MKTHKTEVVKNIQEKSILVTREFEAPVEMVWRAYTESALLDQWWGPAPWHAETKYINFKPGGHWLYAMVGPEGERHWGRMNYKTIDLHHGFDIEDAFCDENGEVNPELPVSRGRISFIKTAKGTRVEFVMTYESAADVEKLIEMGFEEGITICFEQLAELLRGKV